MAELQGMKVVLAVVEVMVLWELWMWRQWWWRSWLSPSTGRGQLCPITQDSFVRSSSADKGPHHRAEPDVHSTSD